MNSSPEIISLDPSKIWYRTINNTTIVYKKTSEQEKDNLIKAKYFLNNKSIKVNNISYSIDVPDVYSWNPDNSTLSMSYCSGKNLELLLRNPNTRNSSIPFLQSMMRFVLKQNFYWQDFAPRNIIINDKTIFLVDFEKGLNFHIDNLKTFFRNHVFEEYTSFLLPNERLISTEQIFEPSAEEKNQQLEISSIKVKRIKSIAEALGYTNFISIADYLNFQSMIIKAEEPFFSGETLIFPRIGLVKMLENKNIDPSVYKKYASEILSKNGLSQQHCITAKQEIERD